MDGSTPRNSRSGGDSAPGESLRGGDVLRALFDDRERRLWQQLAQDEQRPREQAAADDRDLRDAGSSRQHA